MSRFIKYKSTNFVFFGRNERALSLNFKSGEGLKPPLPPPPICPPLSRTLGLLPSSLNHSRHFQGNNVLLDFLLKAIASKAQVELVTKTTTSQKHGTQSWLCILLQSATPAVNEWLANCVIFVDLLPVCHLLRALWCVRAKKVSCHTSCKKFTAHLTRIQHNRLPKRSTTSHLLVRHINTSRTALHLRVWHVGITGKISYIPRGSVSFVLFGEYIE